MGRVPLLEKDKLKIVEELAQGKSMYEVAKKIKKPYSTVKSFYQTYKKRGSIINKKQTGRKKIVNQRTKRRIKTEIKKNRSISLSELKNTLNINASTTTIYRTIKNLGILFFYLKYYMK